jgi:hypothetical protein
VIVHRVKQGSVEWHMARAGVITASQFHLTRASAKLKAGPNKGDYNDKAKNLAFKLAIERIAGQPIECEDWAGWQADRGIALEPKAREAHEARGVIVEEAGFITTDDGKFGASADGFLYGKKAGAEYKCFLAPEKLKAIYLTGSTDDVIDQCDGGMWLSGMDEWHFGLFCPALAPIGLDFVLHIIKRDDNRIYELERDLLAFDRLVCEYEAALRLRAIGGSPVTEALPWEAPAPGLPPLPIVPPVGAAAPRAARLIADPFAA